MQPMNAHLARTFTSFQEKSCLAKVFNLKYNTETILLKLHSVYHVMSETWTILLMAYNCHEKNCFSLHYGSWKCTFFQSWEQKRPQLWILLKHFSFLHLILCSTTIACRCCLGELAIWEQVVKRNVCWEHACGL